jgi:hypothetical protein
MGRYCIFTVKLFSRPDARVAILQYSDEACRRRSPASRVSPPNDHGLGTGVKMLGHSLERDGLSPIPTEHQRENPAVYAGFSFAILLLC